MTGQREQEEELLRTKGALRQSEEFSRSIIESTLDCIEMLGLDGTLLWISATGRDAFRIADPGTVIGSFWINNWQGDDRAAAAAAVREAIAGGVGRFVGRLRIQGKAKWWNVAVTPMLDADGKTGKLLAVSREVTEWVLAESALRAETRILELLNLTGALLASQLELQKLVQAVTDAGTELSGAQFGAFFHRTADERDDTFALYTLSGAPREAFEKLGKPRITDLFAPTFRDKQVIRLDDVLTDPRFAQTGAGMPPGHLPVRSYLAVPVISRSEKVIGVLLFGHAEVGMFGERVERLLIGLAAQAAIALDNAQLYEEAQKSAEERKQLLESERAARGEAERLNALKDDFLATLSHELRTPLSAILGWSQILRRRRTAADDLDKGLEIIERNARVQTKLIEDLLDMSSIISGKVRLEAQPVPPASFVEAAIETVRPLAAAKEIRLEALLDPAADPVSGDPNRLQQVIWNLLSNALKFTPRGGSIQVRLERAGSYIEIAVADSGIGIKPEFLPQVFERFRQADASTTRKYGGLGLGLSIVKSIVELHGGNVSAQSPGDGLGATFIVQLPLARGRAAAPSSAAHPATPAAALDFMVTDLSDITVLVVDDEPDACLLIRRLLEDCGARVLTATAAETALELIRREHPDVLVSDIGMPDIDGYRLLRLARDRAAACGGKLPAIALTAFARSEDRTRALRAGFQYHIAKPLDPSELVAMVASAAGRTAA